MKTIIQVGLAIVLAITQNPKGYGIGDTVQDFRLKNVDGRMVSLADYRSGKGAIIVFMANHCPYAKAYEDRIITLADRYESQGFHVIAIQPSDPAAYEEDSFVNMQVRAREKGYSFPYLVDETQVVARAFGATRTPQAFVLKRTGDRFIVQYIGSIDDSPQDAAGVRVNYVEEAVTNTLADRPVVTSTTKAIGCAIKWRGL